MPDNHIAPENSFQPWRICSVDTSLAYAIILTFSWICSTQGIQSDMVRSLSLTSIRHIENRNLCARGSSRWLSRISGYVLKLLHWATFEFQKPSLSKWGSRCTTFLVKMSFICMRMKNNFHIKGWAPALVLKQRPGGTRKWPIIVSASLGLQVPCGFVDPSDFAAFHELSLAQGILLPPHFAVSLGLYPCGFRAQSIVISL